ncbi:MAG: ATP-binding protein, partial [Anaerolineales bacterium]
VLQARLDSLQDYEREVIQEASIIGRIFWDQVIRYMHISTHGNGEVEHIPIILSSLREKEMIFRREVSSFSGAREYLFKHEILRDVTYESVLLKMRRKYHGMVADWLLRHALERKEEFTGSIAEHLELAGRDAEAAVYLQRAGQLAQQVFANEEAINYYQRCLVKIEPLIERFNYNNMFFEVNESMGDILGFTGKFAEARQYYSRVMPLLDSSNIIHKARLQRKIGDAWRNQGQYKEAQNAYQAAQSILADSSDNDNAQWWQEWLEINFGTVSIYYWIDQVDQILHRLEDIRPIVESHGTNRQRARYFSSFSMMLARRERYCISEQSLANYRLALELVESTGKPDFSMRFGLGFLLLWHGDLDESEDDLKTTLSFAEKTGDLTLQTRCLTYLTILYRFQGLPEKVSELASQTFSSAVDNKMPEYAFAARANQSWLAWREGNYHEAESLASEAFEWLTQTKVKYPLKWLALFPLTDIALKKDHLDQAVECARDLDNSISSHHC